MFPKCSLNVLSIAMLREHSPSIPRILRACWVLPVKECFFQFTLKAITQSRAINNIHYEIQQSQMFSLSTYSLTKFNTSSQVFFTWSHLKHRFLKNFCIILFVSEKGSYCWYDQCIIANMIQSIRKLEKRCRVDAPLRSCCQAANILSKILTKPLEIRLKNPQG